ncbi:MAG: hypothetical protein ACREGI_01235 [Candidatus Levyibacteriota bacterium]
MSTTDDTTLPLPQDEEKDAATMIKEEQEAQEENKREEEALESELTKGEQEDLQQTPPTDDTDKFTRDIEKELTLHILNNIRTGELSEEDAEKLADEFLLLLPAKDKEDLLNKLDALGGTFPEAKQTYATYIVPMEEEKRLKALEEMRKHIQTGNIEQAIAVAKGGK